MPRARRHLLGPLAALILLAAYGGPATPAADAQLAGALSRGGLTVVGAGPGDRAGRALAPVGDVNGDGLADLATAAPTADPQGRTDAGSVFIVFGQPSPTSVDTGTLADRGFRIDGAAAGDQLGWSLDSAGDVDGDGWRDLVIGARGLDPSGRVDAGGAYVVYGARRSPGSSLDLAALGDAGFRIDGAAAGDRAGTAVSRLGDADGDGRRDVAIGAPTHDPLGRTNAGAAYAVFSPPRGAGTQIDLASIGQGGFQLRGAAADDRAGTSVASAGDVNADGRGDVAVGANLADPAGRLSAGAAYLAPSPAAPAPVDLGSVVSAGGAELRGAVTNDRLGQSIGPAGDIDGDARQDVAVGAPLADPYGRANAGAAYLVLSSTFTSGIRDLATGALPRLAGAGTGDETGGALASAGDPNGDGRDDLLVTAPRSNALGSDSGATYVVFGRAGGPGDLDLRSAGEAAHRIPGPARDALGGTAVAGVGDVNGDGHEDVVTSAEWADPLSRRDAGFAQMGHGFGQPRVSYAAGIDGPAGGPLGALTPTVERTGETRFSVDGELPRGLVLDPATGTLSGSLPLTPMEDGEITIRMTDFAGTATAKVRVNARPVDGVCANPFVGTPGPDTLVGTPMGDDLSGREGDDVLDGLDGADCLLGYTGDDRLAGGAGDDQLLGDAGADALEGGPGDDLLEDKIGAGSLAGGDGHDALFGGEDGDLLAGGAGNDRLNGRRGPDRVLAGAGADRVNAADRHRDVVRCGSGRDSATVNRGDRVSSCERVRRR